jgi:hypothetical protein
MRPHPTAGDKSLEAWRRSLPSGWFGPQLPSGRKGSLRVRSGPRKRQEQSAGKRADGLWCVNGSPGRSADGCMNEGGSAAIARLADERAARSRRCRELSAIERPLRAASGTTRRGATTQDPAPGQEPLVQSGPRYEGPGDYAARQPSANTYGARTRHRRQPTEPVSEGAGRSRRKPECCDWTCHPLAGFV